MNGSINNRWGKLSLKEKNTLLGIYASKGYTDLASIIAHYNSFADGGRLTLQQWKSKMQSKYPDIEMDNDKAGYDYDSYFNDNYDAAVRQLSDLRHFPDTYKLPNHRTFSNESMYSRGPMIGGQWTNAPISNKSPFTTERFTPSNVNRQYYSDIYKENRPYSEGEIYHSFAPGGFMQSPDWDPEHPYHYHNAEGEKVVITPEDWEANVGKPYFREIEAAVKAEQAAHPEPEYEVNPGFVRDLRYTYQYNMGRGYQNYRNFGSYLPQGYSFTDEGLIVDPQGNYYVQSGYRQSPRFTYSTDNPLQFTINKGKSNERNLTFYPVNMDKRVKSPLPVDRTLDISKEHQNAIDNYIQDNTTAKQRINYVPSSFIYPFMPREYWDYSSFDKKGNDKMMSIARKEGFKRIIPNFSGHRAGGDFLVGFTDDELQKFKQRFWNKFEQDFANDPTYDGYYWVDGDGYDRATFLDPEFGITKFNPTVGSRVEQLPELINKYPDKYKDFRDWYGTGPNGNSGYQTRYEGGSPSRKEAEKKAVIKIGPLEQLGTYAKGGHLFSPGGYLDEPQNGYYTYQGIDGKTIGISSDLYNKYKDDPLFKNKLKGLTFVENTETENPEYNLWLKTLNRLYASTNNNPAYYYPNYRNFGNRLPQGYSINENGIVFDSNGVPYVQGTFLRANGQYEQDGQPVTFKFNEGKPIERNVTYYPLGNIPSKTIMSRPPMDYEITEDILNNSILNNPTYQPDSAVLRSVSTEQTTIPSEQNLNKTGRVSGHVPPFRNYSLRDIRNDYTQFLGTDLDVTPFFPTRITEFDQHTYKPALVYANYDKMLQDATLLNAPREVIRQIKDASQNYDNYIKEIYPYASQFYTIKHKNHDYGDRFSILKQSLGRGHNPIDPNWKLLTEEERLKYSSKIKDLKLVDIYNKGNLLIENNKISEAWDYYNNVYLPAVKSYANFYKKENRKLADTVTGITEKYKSLLPTTFEWFENLPQETKDKVKQQGDYTGYSGDKYFPGYFNFGDNIYYSKGGKLNEPDNPPSPLNYFIKHTQYPKSNIPFTDVDDKTWMKWWYDNRQKQLKDNYDEYYLQNDNSAEYSNFDKYDINRAIDFANLWPIQFTRKKDWPKDVEGETDSNSSTIYLDPSAKRLHSNRLHEKIHAFSDELANGKYYPIVEPSFDQATNEIGNVSNLPYNPILNAISPSGFLNPDINRYPNSYWDNTNEVYSRLMEMRRALKLLPTDIQTKEDIDKWRKDGTLEKYMLHMYNDSDLLYLFNNVAQNNTKNLSHYAAQGGHLFAPGGNLGHITWGGPVGIDSSLAGSAATAPKPMREIARNYNEEMARSRGNSYTGNKGDEVRRKLLNDTPTAQQSQDLEDAMHKAIYNSVEYNSPKYDYTIPYIYDKEIKINGHRTSENVLDTLYKYSQETGLPFVDALGLAGQETGYGSMPVLNIIPENLGLDLDTGLTAKEENRILANANYFRNYGSIPANNLVRDFAWENTDMSQHPLIHAFNYFKAGKYNTGDPNHTSDVRRTGQKALESKAVREWAKRKGITFDNGGHLHYNGSYLDEPDNPPVKTYNIPTLQPIVSTADNTRVVLQPTNLFEEQFQQALQFEEEAKAQAEFERRQARRAKNEAEARAIEAERRAKTPAILREPTAAEKVASHSKIKATAPINTSVIYDKTRAELEEQAANWGRSVGSVATMTPEMVSRNPLTAVALGGLGEMAFLSGRYPFTNFRQTLSTAGELLSPSTYTELLGASPVVGNLANNALGADIAYHSMQDLPEAAESFRLNNDLGSGLRTGLDLLGVSPLYSMGKAGDLLNKGIKFVERTPQFRHLKRSWNRTYNNSYYPENYVENVLNAKYPKAEYPDDVNVVENFKVRDKVANYKERIKEQLDRDKDKLTSYLQQPERFTQEDVTRINNLYKVSPEYVEFLMENPTLNPFAQSTLDSFIARQSRSVRGIHVPISEVNNVFDLAYDKNGKLRGVKDNNFIELTFDSKENLTDFQIKPKTSEMIAEEYLTIPPVSGPDRLGNAGLYTSNGRFIADKFMRPETSAPETSYIGELRYNFNIDRTKPIEEQLRQYRNSIDNWFDLGLTDTEASMIEAPYTRATGETSEGIYERSVNTNGRNPVVQLEKLHDFGTGNENLHGRWGLEDGDADLDLFIPKRFSQDYRDFIRFTRNAKQRSTTEYRTENTTRHTAREEVGQHVRDRETKYRRLQTQHKENKDKFQRYSQASILGAGGAGTLYGLFALGKKGTPRSNWYIEHEEELSKITRKEIGPLPSKDASDAEWEAYMEKEYAIIEREYKKAKQSKKKQ